MNIHRRTDKMAKNNPKKTQKIKEIFCILRRRRCTGALQGALGEMTGQKDEGRKREGAVGGMEGKEKKGGGRMGMEGEKEK